MYGLLILFFCFPSFKFYEYYISLFLCGDWSFTSFCFAQHDSMGPKGGFSYFVFKQLYEKRQISKLLRLGEEFQEELSIFLKHHRNLLWLHELFLHQFSSASETLHVLALSQDETSISEAEETTDHVQNRFITTLADRKRLLNLSKIAIMAGMTYLFSSLLSRFFFWMNLLIFSSFGKWGNFENHATLKLVSFMETAKLSQLGDFRLFYTIGVFMSNNKKY